MRIGLTGGIASGKSEIENNFRGNWFHIFNVDEADFIIRTGRIDTYDNILISENLVCLAKKISKEVIISLKQKLPNLYDKNNIFSRDALIFYINDTGTGLQNLNIYNQIIGPASIELYSEWCKHLPDSNTVLSSAVLIERENLHLIDELYILRISSENQLRNLLRRQEIRKNPISENEAKMAINRQLSFDEKFNKATLQIWINNIHVIDL